MLTEDPSVKTIMHRVKEGNLSHAAERRCPGFLFLFLFLFLSEFFLSHCICPQSLLRLHSPSGRPNPACRSPAIGEVFPCCNEGDLKCLNCVPQTANPPSRSEERRVGKECRSRW